MLTQEREGRTKSTIIKLFCLFPEDGMESILGYVDWEERLSKLRADERAFC
ncbi:hypothetical protein Geob_3885 [Geotalea daltonii FRC-32]|uniref:Uncharacterized protein n=1 Tax=Geotalea daltonii (strain DSM 22248 / JCM 15807 / FRC-32) TaxID=316067 RepID=A0A068F6D4_GEODF|nr:hypothetical protein Geob_3885 [Geotalea daltonii FRC-32]